MLIAKNDAGNEAKQSTAIKFNYVQSEPGPAISEIAPEGAVYQGEIMLTAVTDVPAVCRYSGEDREFEEMTDLFSASDDGLHQSAMITLSDYGNYDYYIRCRDEKGNTQGSYAAVAFEYKDPAASGEAPVSLECTKLRTATGTANATILWTAFAIRIVRPTAKTKMRTAPEKPLPKPAAIRGYFSCWDFCWF